MKRSDYISWDEYFMGIAMLAAKRSKDPNTQVGACIVSQDNIIISTGYNGMPKGCSDDEYPWEREGDQTKYPYVVHAELNAVLNANGRDLRGSKLYVALFPCNECAKAIIQSGVKEVYYLSDKYADSMSTLASKKMMDSAGVKYTQLRTNLKEITLDFIPEEERKNNGHRVGRPPGRPAGTWSEPVSFGTSRTPSPTFRFLRRTVGFSPPYPRI